MRPSGSQNFYHHLEVMRPSFPGVSRGHMGSQNSYCYPATTSRLPPPRPKCQWRPSKKPGLSYSLSNNPPAPLTFFTECCQKMPTKAKYLNKIWTFITYPKCQILITNYSKEKKKTINRCLHWHETNVRIIWQRFKSSHHKNASLNF